MKKLLVGLLVLGSFSAFATEGLLDRDFAIEEITPSSSFMVKPGHFQSLTKAFKNCLSEGIYNNITNVNKTRVDGSSEVRLSFDCQNDGRAKPLYETMNEFSSKSIRIWSKGNRVAKRTVGNLSCYRELEDENGNSSSNYWCILDLSLSNNFIKALDL